MPFSDTRVILASASPRRRELLKLILSDFEICPSPKDEHMPEGLSPEDTVIYLSREKARAVSSRGGLVIGADTLVYLDGEPLGKPTDEGDAKRMLRALSGREHAVYTGVTVLDSRCGREFSAAEKTRVFFCEMSEDDISRYVSSGEPMDKAGAYGIQGGAARFISSIDGCYFNVMGLPVHRTYMLLKAAEEAYAQEL